MEPARAALPAIKFGTDPTFALACAMPYGIHASQQNAWMYLNGGLITIAGNLHDMFRGIAAIGDDGTLRGYKQASSILAQRITMVGR